ncbi:MAG TPA: phosphotransferase [Solirubrobacteraceae bacterium]|nr:phosphotransferase [Solirubrobacteraceae bacterium]
MLRERGPVVVRSSEELTSDWLTAALGLPEGALRVLGSEPIGTGQMSQSHRVHLEHAGGEGPDSLVVKLASPDPTSRATGQWLGAYLREVEFYRRLAGRIGGPTMRCHAAAIDDEGWFTLVLEDAIDTVQGDQVAGCEAAHARLAMCALAELHAPVYGDAALGAADWLNVASPLRQGLVAQLLPGFLERYEDRIEPEHVAVCRRFVESIDGWVADARPPLGLVHGDYRLDNVLFATDGVRPPRIVDWQTVSWGPMMLDAAYFIGGSLKVEDRRAHERELLALYHEAMLERGARDLDWDACWEGYRRQCLYGLLMCIAAAMVVARTERGDEMFTTMLARYAQQAIDLESVSLLPPAGQGRPAPLVPAAEDEGRHSPTADQLWNESYYFDAIADDASLGAYVRVGLYPNLGVAWYTAFVCRPGRESLAVIDFAAPLPPAGSISVQREGLRAEHACESPLLRFRATLEAEAEAYADPAAVLRGERGEPRALALDLVWDTDGAAYAYRMTTRYEVPCRVSGTIRIGDEVLALSGSGQRDHSWGTRDWWAMDWMWSAAAFEDGTRLHAVALRIPGAPVLSVGYVQHPAGKMIELEAVETDEDVAADGLIEHARIAVDEGLPQLDVRPLAFGPLLLEAPDGRVAHFPRAMCRFQSEDGLRGLGWVEWNRNQPG